jgi:hypothetical protein
VSDSPSEPAIDPAGRVVGDLPCIGCGYNLNTLPEAGRCPECGQPVQRSTSHHLRPSPVWLKSMSEGVSLLIAGTAVTAIGGAVLVLGSVLLGAGLWPFPVFALLALGAVTAVRLTAPEPRRISRPFFSWRRVTRVCLALIPVGPVLALALAFSRYAWCGVVLAWLPVILFGSAFFCHMALLMRRVLRPDLERWARRLALAYAGSLSVFAWWYGATRYVPLSWPLPAAIPLCIWGACFGTLLVLAFIFMIYAGRALTAAQHRAEHWRSGPQGVNAEGEALK